MVISSRFDLRVVLVLPIPVGQFDTVVIHFFQIAGDVWPKQEVGSETLTQYVERSPMLTVASREMMQNRFLSSSYTAFRRSYSSSFIRRLFNFHCCHATYTATIAITGVRSPFEISSHCFATSRPIPVNCHDSLLLTISFGGKLSSSTHIEASSRRCT